MGEYYQNAYRLFQESLRNETGDITNPAATCLSMCSNKECFSRKNKKDNGTYDFFIIYPNKVDIAHQSKTA